MATIDFTLKDFETMVERIVGRELEFLAVTVKQEIDRIDHRFDGVDTSITAIDRRFDKMDQRFDKMDERFDGIDGRLATIDQRFDKMDERFDHIDTELHEIKIDIKGIKRVQRKHSADITELQAIQGI